MIITYKKVARLFEKNALQVAYKVTEWLTIKLWLMDTPESGFFSALFYFLPLRYHIL